ncbi:MAG TPA: SGNH/GDSL hydrolase family protein [Marmoricola sp.]|nr:SGNH/GDSL hydrolase family protein [Marmoricola sp.]
MPFHRYVALGDSFTEGVGDPDPRRPNGVRGWADRVAEVLCRQPDADPFGYANLAIRGRKLQGIVDEQLEPALALDPDLVTIYAGANDVMRPKVDIDALAASYDEAVGKLAGSGATVVMFTSFDPGGSALYRPLRGRWALYNESAREIADRHQALLVDFWRMREFRDWSMWAEDRMHLSSAGHQQMAIKVLDRLGVAHDLGPLPLAERPVLTPREARRANLVWARTHAAPWVHRRLTGRSSGDGILPRRPICTPVDPLP